MLLLIERSVSSKENRAELVPFIVVGVGDRNGKNMNRCYSSFPKMHIIT